MLNVRKVIVGVKGYAASHNYRLSRQACVGFMKACYQHASGVFHMHHLPYSP